MTGDGVEAKAGRGVAGLETVLASAAESVPEAEAVDAETVEVTQALDREMAEARPAGADRKEGEVTGAAADAPHPKRNRRRRSHRRADRPRNAGAITRSI